MSAVGLIDRASRGELPDWAVQRPARRAHTARVAALMDRWAAALGLDDRERVRWRAAGWLHDALRDEDPETLRTLVRLEFRDLGGPLLHGPAAAERLRDEGVDDEGLLRAIAFHTIGHPEFDRLGRALYLADYLEPGRTFDPAGGAALRARMPEAMDEVLREVASARVAHLVRARRSIRPETLRFWNSLVEER